MYGRLAMNPEEQNQQIQELFLLQRVAHRINSILDLDALLAEIVGDVAETFGYTRSGVLLKDDWKLMPVCRWEYLSVNFPTTKYRCRLGVVFSCIQTGLPKPTIRRWTNTERRACMPTFQTHQLPFRVF